MPRSGTEITAPPAFAIAHSVGRARDFAGVLKFIRTSCCELHAVNARRVMALMARRIVLLSLLQLVSAKVKSGATSSADLGPPRLLLLRRRRPAFGDVHSFQNVALLLYGEQTMVASRLEDTTSCSQLQNRSHTQSPLHATARGAAFRWRFVPQHTTPYPRWSVAVAACDASELSLTYELGFVNSAEPWWSAQLSCEASLALPLAFAYLLLMAPLAVLLLRSAWRERARHPEPPSDAADAPPPPPRHLPIASLGAAAACAAAAGALATVANLIVYARHGRGLRLLRFVAGVGDVGCEVALLALLVLLLDRLAHGAPPPSQPLAPEALLRSSRSSPARSAASSSGRRARASTR